MTQNAPAALRINTASLRETAESLKAGTPVLLSGTVYTARDAAHKRFVEMLDRGETLPFDIKGAVIYYAGPTPARPGMACGSCGPTTSGRMDVYAPRLLQLGLAAMIGKGGRSTQVIDAMHGARAVYFCAVGGAGALIARSIRQSREIAFFDLGCESVKCMQVEDMPLITAIDCHGGNLFEQGPPAYRQKADSVR